MSSTESPFSANMRVRLSDHDVQLTVRGDTSSDFNLRWAELAESMPMLVESIQLTVAASNAASLTQQPVGTPPPAPAAVVSDGGWATPAPSPQAAPPPAFSAAVAPVCAHGPRQRRKLEYQTASRRSPSPPDRQAPSRVPSRPAQQHSLQ